MNEIYNTNKIKFKLYLWKLIILIIINSITSIKFYFQMDSTSMRCLGEYLSDKTLGIKLIFYFIKKAIINIKCSKPDIRVRLFDPNGNTVIIKV